jgi:hypothetical protein
MNMGIIAQKMYRGERLIGRLNAFAPTMLPHQTAR